MFSKTFLTYVCKYVNKKNQLEKFRAPPLQPTKKFSPSFILHGSKKEPSGNWVTLSFLIQTELFPLEKHLKVTRIFAPATSRASYSLVFLETYGEYKCAAVPVDIINSLQFLIYHITSSILYLYGSIVTNPFFSNLDNNFLSIKP